MERFVIETKDNKKHLCEDHAVPEVGDILGKYVVQAKQKLNGIWHLSLDTLFDAGIKSPPILEE